MLSHAVPPYPRRLPFRTQIVYVWFWKRDPPTRVGLANPDPRITEQKDLTKMTRRITAKERRPDQRTMEDAHELPVGSDYSFSVPNRLYLGVKTATSRNWYVRYNIAGLGKAGEGKVSFGNIREVSLDAAMERARLVQKDAANGIDPKGEKGCEGGLSRGNPSFGTFAEAHLAKKLPRLKNKKHQEKYASSIRRYTSFCLLIVRNKANWRTSLASR